MSLRPADGGGLGHLIAAAARSCLWARLDRRALPGGRGGERVDRVPLAVPGRRARGGGCVGGACQRAGGALVAGHGSSLVLIPVTLAVYTVVATAGKRTALAAVGAAVAVIEAGAFVAAGGADETVVLSAPRWPPSAGWPARTSGRAAPTSRRGRACGRARARAGPARRRRGTAPDRTGAARRRRPRHEHHRRPFGRRPHGARLPARRSARDPRHHRGHQPTGPEELRLLVGVLRDAETVTWRPVGSRPRAWPTSRAGQPDQRGRRVVGLRVEGEPRPLAPGVDLSAYRIVQEALTNVVRHAAPASAELTLRYRPASW